MIRQPYGRSFLAVVKYPIPLLHQCIFTMLRPKVHIIAKTFSLIDVSALLSTKLRCFVLTSLEWEFPDKVAVIFHVKFLFSEVINSMIDKEHTFLSQFSQMIWSQLWCHVCPLQWDNTWPNAFMNVPFKSVNIFQICDD